MQLSLLAQSCIFGLLDEQRVTGWGLGEPFLLCMRVPLEMPNYLAISVVVTTAFSLACISGEMFTDRRDTSLPHEPTVCIAPNTNLMA